MEFTAAVSPPEAGDLRLPLGRYRFRFVLRNPQPVPHFTGSAWRSALDQWLKQVVCPIQHEECAKCLAYRACPYAYIFETPLPEGTEKTKVHGAPPEPFALSLPKPLARPVSRYELGLTLFGRANHYLGYIVLALEKAAAKGIWSKVLMELEGVDQEPLPGQTWEPIGSGQLQPYPPASPQVPQPPRRVRVELLSPLRLHRHNGYVQQHNFRFSDLFGQLLCRMSQLRHFHTDQPLKGAFKQLIEAARAVQICEAQLRWLEWKSYSCRQETVLEIGGLVGSFIVRSSELGPLWPYLYLGQWTQVGQGTSMGLGQYRLEAVDEVHFGKLATPAPLVMR